MRPCLLRAGNQDLPAPGNLVLAAGFEPAASTFAGLRSYSAELREQTCKATWPLGLSYSPCRCGVVFVVWLNVLGSSGPFGHLPAPTWVPRTAFQPSSFGSYLPSYLPKSPSVRVRCKSAVRLLDQERFCLAQRCSVGAGNVHRTRIIH